MNSSGSLLSIRLSVDYPGKPGVLRTVALEMERGEILGLVGESGSGKSTLALATLRLLQLRGGRACGQIMFSGRDLMRLTEREMQRVRGREISLVLQSPTSSLNPVLRIGTQLSEAWTTHASHSRNHCQAAIREVMESVDLPADEAFLRRYPSQISVGQAQRVLICMAILHRPSVLIADEPTSALDMVTQSEILRLFARLNRELNMAILYISHDLMSVASLCHRVAILREGEILECGKTEQIFRSPGHAYTRRLIESLPHSSFVTVRDPVEEAPACIDFSAIPKVIAPSSGLAANEGLPSMAM
jgi:ABC-type dipeptide/oligopeptide/nickel transport system ATPase component